MTREGSFWSWRWVWGVKKFTCYASARMVRRECKGDQKGVTSPIIGVDKRWEDRGADIRFDNEDDDDDDEGVV